MPFDGKLTDFVSVPTVKPFEFETASPDERLIELARLLENEQEWRDSLMEWDFDVVSRESRGCGTAGCAIGLAMLRWPGKCADGGDRAFALNSREWSELFSVDFAERQGLTPSDITPGMVATAIREFVAKRSNPAPAGDGVTS